MPRKGRLLEQLVKHFQEQLAPQGVVVQSPEEFRDANGNKLGEIDVTLRGRFGTSRIFIGIECRDRPADAPQGNDWITQIDGKKRLFGADRMIALSSTGFTPSSNTSS